MVKFIVSYEDEYYFSINSNDIHYIESRCNDEQFFNVQSKDATVFSHYDIVTNYTMNVNANEKNIERLILKVSASNISRFISRINDSFSMTCSIESIQKYQISMDEYLGIIEYIKGKYQLVSNVSDDILRLIIIISNKIGYAVNNNSFKLIKHATINNESDIIINAHLSMFYASPPQTWQDIFIRHDSWNSISKYLTWDESMSSLHD